MATATELAINTSATALDMANAIFGPGVTVVSASYTGDPLSAGTYSGATTTIPGISPTSTGVILSTGRAADFTNSSGKSDTNTATNTSTDTTGVNGDAQLNAIAGMTTYDAAILNASFIPDGDILTMQFVFSSEEYPEYVSGGVNDSFGVWVNGAFVPVSITVAGNVAIDEVNGTKNENLYINNTGDQYNTEMDGFTYVLSFKAPVNAGQVNTIKIGIADGGDAIYDSNLLIMGDSAQTVTLAMDDKVNVLANNQRTFDILGNDNATTGTLTITQINGQNVVAGQTITLTSGQQVRLNADGTITVFSNGVLGAENLSYTITNGTTTDVGYITINTVTAATKDGIVSGTSGNDVIQAGYVGDPDGDLIDSNDGTGVLGTTGNSDLIYAGAGNDSIVSAEGNDVIFGGAGVDTVYGGNGNDTIDGDDGNDLIYGGAGNDALTGGTGADSLYGGAGTNVIYAGDGADQIFAEALAVNTVYGGTGNDTVTMDSGNDTVLAGDNDDIVYGGAGADSLLGEAGADLIDAGSGNDTLDGGAGADQLTGGAGNDSVLGGDDNDTLFLANGFGLDTLAGGEAGLDTDILNAATMTANTTVTFSGAEAGSLSDGTNTAGFSQIEQLVLGSGNDLITGGVGNEIVYAGAGNDTAYGGAGNDTFDMGQGNDSYGTTAADSAGNDTIYGGDGADSIVTGQNNDVIYGGTGADTLSGGMGSDSVYGGDDNDLITVLDDSEFDLIQGGEGGVDNDTLSFGNTLTTAGVTVTLTGAEQGSYAFNATPSGYAQATGTYTQIEVLSGTGYADTFNGTSSSAGAVINANAGNDTVNAGSGNDQIDGGSGNDQIRDSAGNDTVYGGAGVDDLLSGTGNDQIFGGSESDLITLLDTSGNDTIAAGEGGETGGGDALNLDITSNATVTFTGNEAGTAVFGSNTTSFTEFETVITDLGNDLINASVTTGGQTLYAGAGQDTVLGGAGNDSIWGEAGNDSLVGGAGNDTILGDAGNDTLTGGSGRDQLFGGNDVDSFYAGGNATVQGGEGGTDNDTLIVSNVVGLVYGGGTNEAGTLTLADGTTVTFSEIEHLVLNGGTPDGIIMGTSGSDSIGAGFVDVNGDVTDNNDALLGNVGSNDDEVYAGAGNDTISGLAGNDFLYGGDNNDSIDGGAANDYIQGDAGNDTANGGDGNDFIRGDAGNDLVYGGTGDDSVYGGSESDRVYGGDGNDRAYGGTGDDSVYGGIGNDSVTGSEGNDSVFGDDGNDYVQGSSGNDTLFGGLGNDTLLGEEDADLIYGGVGDYVDGYESVTTGTDNDTLQVSGIASITWDKLNPENGTITYGSGQTLAFYNIEHVFVDGIEVFAPNFIVEGTGGADLIDGSYVGDPQGDRIDASDNLPGNNDDLVQAGGGNDTVISGAGGDSIYAGTGDDSVVAGDGNDTILGEDGNDRLYGGAGNDLIDGGLGNDTIWAGTGNDTLTGAAGDDVFVLENGFGLLSVTGGETGQTLGDTLDASAVTGNVVVNLGAGDPANPEDGTLTLSGNTVTFAEIETIILGGGNDTLTGSTGNDNVQLGAGNDQAYGGTGNDSLSGGTGNDLLDGGTGNDALVGGSGLDTLIGGAGTDQLWLGAMDGSADTIRLADGFGSDIAHEFEGPVFSGGLWLGQDKLDVSGLQDAKGNPVNVNDVTVTSDGSGNAVLNFPNGETLTLTGVSPATLATPEALVAIGIPAEVLNFIVDGTAGGDLIDASYVGDPQGDLIDAADNLASTNDDVVQAGAGNDTVNAGAGQDSVRGEADNDALYGAGGNDSLDGGTGADALFGGTGNDLLLGGAGNDVLTGGDGIDQMSGGDDRDTFFGGVGDVIDGGSGGNDNDTLDLTAYGHSGTTINYGGGDGKSGTVDILDGSGAVIGSIAFTNIENVIACFTSGTMIATDLGEVPVQDLGPGDQVLTRDDGFAKVIWAGSCTLSAAELIARPEFQPVRISKGALGQGIPVRDMMVSPQHRMLWCGPDTELLFGETEVLVAAIHLVGLPGIHRACPAEGVTYHHVMFAQHEILRGDGAWSESFQPGAATLNGLQDDQRAEILALFPQLEVNPGTYPAARMTLKSREARVLLAI